MKVVAFSGPTVPHLQIQQALSSSRVTCEVRPPALRGDVLAAALAAPQVIVLIDGYFDRVPSVWHKEILWALSRGIHVWGASSMGALRAAELADFGMVGVGKIYDDYRAGIITEDDAVAVAHTESTDGFRSTSDALVNIRATLASAVAAGVVDQTQASWLLGLASATPYWQRSFRALIESARAGAEPEVASRLRDWLPQGRVDQKAEDARQLCERLRSSYDELREPFRPRFVFSQTDAWLALRTEVDARQQLASRDGEDNSELLLDEVLVRAEGLTLLQSAMSRALAERGGGSPQLGVEAVRAVVAEFRRERGLNTPSQFDAWLAEQHLAGSDADSFFRSEAAFRRSLAIVRPNLARHLLSELRGAGRVEELLRRGERKRSLLRQRGLEQPSLADARVSEENLWRWYYAQVRGTPAPAVLPPYGQCHGIDVDVLRRAILREYCYLQVTDTL